MTEKFFDEIFINFKNKVMVNIPEVIDVTDKYFHAEYQIRIFTSYDLWLDTNLMLEDLNSWMKQKPYLQSWDKFYVCTGILDYDIKTCSFISINQEEKNSFINLES